MEDEMKVTEILGIKVTNKELIVPNKSGFYHDVLRAWWDNLEIEGCGLIIGDREEVKTVLKETYPKITEIFTVEIKGEPDILWDITEPFSSAKINILYDKDNFLFDWIICQAVLEHVIDPVAAMKNMSDLLKPEGSLYIHVPGIKCGQHGFPIDCYRFMKDSLTAFEKLAVLEMVDLYVNDMNLMAFYKKL